MIRINNATIRAITYIGLAVVGGGVCVASMSRYANLKERAHIEVVEAVATSVVTRKAVGKRLTEWLPAEGTAHAWRREYVQSDIDGTIVELGEVDGCTIREGMSVRGPSKRQGGDLLARIDSRTLEAERRALKAELELARAELIQYESDYERLKNLYEINSASVHELRRARTAFLSGQELVRVASAKLDRVNVDIGKTVVRAPFDGVIKRINIRVGDYYTGTARWTTDSSREANALMVVIDNRRMEVILNIPLYQADKVNVGQRVYLGYSSRELTAAARSGFTAGEFAVGMIDSKSPSMSLDKRAIRVKVRTNVDSHHLFDGSHVIAWIVTNEREDVLTIPHRAVVSREDGDFAYVHNAASNTVEARQLTIGEFGLDDVEVIKGVEKGEPVVTDGLVNLTDGAPVIVVRSDG